MMRRDMDGNRIRAPRPTVTYGGTDPAELIRYGREVLADIAHLASECMQDHLDDERVIKDMHDIIGCIGHLQSVFKLQEHRLVPKKEHS
jgi:hypothetical protein